MLEKRGLGEAGLAGDPLQAGAGKRSAGRHCRRALDTIDRSVHRKSLQRRGGAIG